MKPKPQLTKCKKCAGEGWHPKGKCFDCDGKGYQNHRDRLRQVRHEIMKARP